jgi:CRP/FNR family transcriptional regulator, dissimilatory nitrate respiration regulator
MKINVKFMKTAIEMISKTPLFSGLDVEALQAVCAITMRKDYDKGQIIFSEGDAGDGFYTIVSGRVKIFKVAPEGKEQILHIFGPGEPFGEVPVFTGRPFPATAQAIAGTSLLFFPKTAFVALIHKNPSLALSMLGVLSMRLREFTVQIENLSLKEVPGRLSSYLLYLSDEQESLNSVKLAISKSQLASLLGTIPETLSRIFTKMTAAQLINVQGGDIELMDRSGLEALAENGKLPEK